MPTRPHIPTTSTFSSRFFRSSRTRSVASTRAPSSAATTDTSPQPAPRSTARAPRTGRSPASAACSRNLASTTALSQTTAPGTPEAPRKEDGCWWSVRRRPHASMGKVGTPCRANALGRCDAGWSSAHCSIVSDAPLSTRRAGPPYKPITTVGDSSTGSIADRSAAARKRPKREGGGSRRHGATGGELRAASCGGGAVRRVAGWRRGAGGDGVRSPDPIWIGEEGESEWGASGESGVADRLGFQSGWGVKGRPAGPGGPAWPVSWAV